MPSAQSVYRRPQHDGHPRNVTPDKHSGRQVWARATKRTVTAATKRMRTPGPLVPGTSTPSGTRMPAGNAARWSASSLRAENPSAPTVGAPTCIRSGVSCRERTSSGGGFCQRCCRGWARLRQRNHRLSLMSSLTGHSTFIPAGPGGCPTDLIGARRAVRNRCASSWTPCMTERGTRAAREARCMSNSRGLFLVPTTDGRTCIHPSHL